MSSLTVQEWQTIITNSAFFNEFPQFWRNSLQLFGTINIFRIIRLRHLLGSYSNNVGAALSCPEVINQILFGIQRRLDVLQRDPNINEFGPIRHENLALDWFRTHIVEPRWVQQYVEAIRGHEDDYYLENPETEVALRDAIATQVRRPGPQPRDIRNQIQNRGGSFNRQNYGANNGQDSGSFRPKYGRQGHASPLLCKHCGAVHSRIRCPTAGTVKRNHRGEMVALGNRPKCFVCGKRDEKKSDTEFHSSENCRFRHPFSRIGINRNCSECGSSLKRCWNCAIPVCLQKNCSQFGHRLSRCPHPQYRPDIVENHGNIDEFSKSIEDRMRALGIQNIPNEIRYLPIDRSKNRGQNNEDIIQDIVQTVEKELVVDNNKEKEICTICFDDINARNWLRCKCKHTYHDDCYTKALQYAENCPLCRGFLEVEFRQNVDSNDENVPTTSQWEDMPRSSINFHYDPNYYGGYVDPNLPSTSQLSDVASTSQWADMQPSDDNFYAPSTSQHPNVPSTSQWANMQPSDPSFYTEPGFAEFGNSNIQITDDNTTIGIINRILRNFRIPGFRDSQIVSLMELRDRIQREPMIITQENAKILGELIFAMFKSSGNYLWYHRRFITPLLNQARNLQQYNEIVQAIFVAAPNIQAIQMSQTYLTQLMRQNVHSTSRGTEDGGNSAN